MLIAGGTGFIGRHLVIHLLELGYRVKVITRNPEAASDILPPQTQIIKWPDVNEKLLLPKNQSCHAFINLTGENIGTLPWTLPHKQKLIQSRLNAIDSLFGFFRYMESPPKIWIQASGIGYYGANPQHICTEMSPVGDGFLAELASKTEQKVCSLKMPETQLAILRFGVVLHPDGGFLKKIMSPVFPGIIACPGKGLNTISWIHLTDAIRVIETSLVNSAYAGIINVTTPNPFKLANLFTLIKTQNPQVMLKIPETLIKLALGKQKTNELVLANQYVVPGFLATHQFGFVYPDIVPQMLQNSSVTISL